MEDNNKIYIYNPSLKTGGTNNLLGNLAILLSNNSKYTVCYIDYLDSPVASIIKKQTTRVNYVLYKTKIQLDNGILIATLLDVKNLQKDFILSENVRLVFWSTHPDDGLKILPSFNIWLRMSDTFSKTIAKILHPFFKERIKKFINTGSINNGIVWMDDVNYNKNKSFYNLSSEKKYWPIFTSFPDIKLSALNVDKENVKIVILGRLTDFKTYPLFGLLDQISEYQKYNKFNISISFIGDGPLKGVIEKWLIEKGIKVFNFMGHVDLSELDSHLISYNLLIGMGMSVLEGAKLKIPSLIMDASYEVLHKEKSKLHWLYSVEPYHVGKIVTNKDRNIEGRTFSEIMNEILNNNEIAYFGNKSYLHWKAYHSPEAILKIVLATLDSNTFYYTKQNRNLLKRDILGYIIDQVKYFLLQTSFTSPACLFSKKRDDLKLKIKT